MNGGSAPVTYVTAPERFVQHCPPHGRRGSLWLKCELAIAQSGPKRWSSASKLTNQVIAAITQQRRFPEPFVREIEERFGDCLDTDYSAGRCNGMSGIVAGKQPNEAETCPPRRTRATMRS